MGRSSCKCCASWVCASAWLRSLPWLLSLTLLCVCLFYVYRFFYILLHSYPTMTSPFFCPTNILVSVYFTQFILNLLPYGSKSCHCILLLSHNNCLISWHFSYGLSNVCRSRSSRNPSTAILWIFLWHIYHWTYTHIYYVIIYTHICTFVLECFIHWNNMLSI